MWQTQTWSESIWNKYIDPTGHSISNFCHPTGPNVREIKPWETWPGKARIVKLSWWTFRSVLMLVAFSQWNCVPFFGWEGALNAKFCLWSTRGELFVSQAPFEAFEVKRWSKWKKWTFSCSWAQMAPPSYLADNSTGCTQKTYFKQPQLIFTLSCPFPTRRWEKCWNAICKEKLQMQISL